MEYTRPATWDDVQTLACYLEEAGVDYALVGGYAIAAHGFNRFSEYIDILVDPAPENSRRWILALSRLTDAAASELKEELDVFADDGATPFVSMDEFTVDVMPSIAGLTWQDMRPHITTTRIDDVDTTPRSAWPAQDQAGYTTQDQMDAAVIAAAIKAMTGKKSEVTCCMSSQ
jgi:hypothetical protein